MEFANQMGLAGVIETSSKSDHELKNIQDSFYICACNCVSRARQEEQLQKSLAMEKQAPPKVKKSEA